MGQLIKVQDFISRYEVDLNRYTNQFVRLKKQQWQLLKLNWQNKEFIQAVDEAEYVENESVLKKVKNWFKKRDDHPYEEEDEKTSIDSSFEFSPQLKYYPDTEEQLKQVFLDQLLKFQLRWASSTLQYMSDVPANMYFDEKLKYFLQRFPDTFLLMYKPVFTFKKASIEMDVILISPLRIWCLTFLEEEKDAVFIGSKEHFWQKRYQHGEKKILSPMIALGRMEKIIKQMFALHHVTLPISKGIISRNGYIDYPDQPNDLHILSKREHDLWFEEQRHLSTPLKHMQLRAAQVLLNYSESNGVLRHDYEEQIENLDEE